MNISSVESVSKMRQARSALMLPQSVSVVFAVSETGPLAAAGDLFTAKELGEAMRARFGWSVSYRPRGEGWYALHGVDVLIAMLEDYDPNRIHGAHRGLLTVGWARNHFESWARLPWVRGFDQLLASSQLAARYLGEQVGRFVPTVMIATNPDRFNAAARARRPALDFVFTGNHWGPMRDVARVLPALPEHFNGAVYGRGWEACSGMERFDRGFVPYSELPTVYRDAVIVIDDANHATKHWGAANSRVFDALAAGCLVISNSHTVSEEVFDGELPVYGSAAELESLLTRYLGDPDACSALQSSLHAAVLRRHTYAHRAFELGVWLSRRMKRRVPR